MINAMERSEVAMETGRWWLARRSGKASLGRWRLSRALEEGGNKPIREYWEESTAGSRSTSAKALRQ